MEGRTQFRFKRTRDVRLATFRAVKTVIRLRKGPGIRLGAANRRSPAGAGPIFPFLERGNRYEAPKVFTSSGFLTSPIPSAVN